jgi:t-SNARE complex subunit (syntaxin)
MELTYTFDFNSESDTSVDAKILHERNAEVKQIEEDISHINEVMITLSGMLAEQGEQLDVVETKIETSTINTEEAKTNLEETEDIVVKGKRLLRDVIIIGSSVVVGAAGFIGGPIIGAATLLSSVTLGTSLVVGIRSKLD